MFRARNPETGEANVLFVALAAPDANGLIEATIFPTDAKVIVPQGQVTKIGS